MNKRAVQNEPVWWLVDLLLLSVILYMSFDYVNNSTDSTTFQRRFIAEDLSLLMDTLYAVPGNIYLTYPQNTLWFSVDIGKNTIRVIDDPRATYVREQSANFIEDKDIRLRYGKFIPQEGYTDKRSFFQKQIAILNIMQRQKQVLDKKQTLNLTFHKTQKELYVLDHEINKDLNQLDCGPIVKKDVTFIKTENNKEFFSTPILLDTGNIISITDTINPDNPVVFLDLSQNPRKNLLKIYFDPGFEKLDGISCNLANNMDIWKDAFISAIPKNNIVLREKTGIDTNVPIILIEISTKVDLSPEELQALRLAIHSTLT